MNLYLILFILFTVATVAGLWGIFTKPGEAGQKVKIQAYESITTEQDKELADKSEAIKEAILVIELIGR